MKRTLSFKQAADESRGDGLPIACGLTSFFARDPEGRGVKPQASAGAETAGSISRVRHVSQPAVAVALIPSPLRVLRGDREP